MKLCITFALFALAVLPAQAAVVKVEKGGAIATIQAGIDAAAAGDTVSVGAGVFLERVTIPANKAGLTLKGGSGTLLDAFHPNGGEGITVLADDVTIVGLTIKNAVSETGTGDAIRLEGDRGRVKNCVMQSCDFHGVVTIGVDPIVDGCRFSSIGRPIEVEGNGLALIRNCRFDQTGDAIDCSTAGSVTVQKCRFTTIDGDAIFGSLGGALVVDRCTFRGVALACAEVEANGDVTCTKNVIDTARRAFALEAGNMTIHDNRMKRMLDDGGGFVLDLDLGTVDVRGNVFDGCNAGAIFLGISSIGVVADNVIKRVNPPEDAAIDVTSASNVDVLDNVLSQIGGDGIRIFEGNGGAIHVRGNSIKDCVRDGIDVTANSIGVVIEDNVVRRCQAEGIDNSGAATTIEGNDVKQCRIDLANDGTANLVANVFVTGGGNVPPEVD